MALSDACFDFIAAVHAGTSDDAQRRAAREFGQAIAHYSESPLGYGDEIETLAYACGDVIAGRRGGNGEDPFERLLFLAEAIRNHLDTPPR
jgi:hypothetical protein